MINFKRSIFAALAIITVSGVALALGPAPYPTGPVEFPEYEIEEGTVRPGERLVYEYSWNGIRAAEVEIEVKDDPDRPGWMCAKGVGRTVGAPRYIYRAEDSVEACMKKDTMKSDEYSIRIRESLDYYDMKVEFDREDMVAHRVKHYRTRKTTKDFTFRNAYDPVSAAALLRSLPWEVGDKRQFEVIDGNERWLIIFEAVEEADVTVKAGTFRCLKMQPSAFEMPKREREEPPGYWEKLAQEEKGLVARMTSFTLWMAKDPPRPFVSARSDVFFGHVDMELIEIKTP